MKIVRKYRKARRRVRRAGWAAGLLALIGLGW
jgi:hypothetical protein